MKLVSLVAVLLCTAVFNRPVSGGGFTYVSAPDKFENKEALFNELNLADAGLSKAAFQLAMKGWQKLKAKGELTKDIITICDFSQSGNNKRLYVIDMACGSLLFNTLVAHGKNTGAEFAHNFSNEPASNKSSLGFYVTKEAYTGEHGLALRLSGKETGFNDKAEERAIVMHGAAYADEDFVHRWGTLGRSWGCPAVSPKYSEQIINAIKDGSCLFIYYPDKVYLAASRLLK